MSTSFVKRLDAKTLFFMIRQPGYLLILFIAVFFLVIPFTPVLVTSQALADEPEGKEVRLTENDRISIGVQRLKESGYYQNESGVWKKSPDDTIPDDHYLHYDRQKHELTLHNVTIENFEAYGIKAVSNEGGPDKKARLHLVLHGTNVISGIAGIVLESNGLASKLQLEISGPGTLVVTGVNHEGIDFRVANMSELIIKGATVIVDGSSGICVTSKGESVSRIVVDGGKLTVLSLDEGITQYGSAGLLVTNNATVRIEEEKLYGKRRFDPLKQVLPDSDGIVFDNKQGIVYGKVTLREDLEISEGESLTIPEEARLIIPEGVTLTVKEGATLTNEGFIYIHNGGNLTGTITGKQLPQVEIEKLPDAIVGKTYSAQLAKTTEGITWHIKEGSELPKGLTLDEHTGVISGKVLEAGEVNFIVVIQNEGGAREKVLSLKVLPASQEKDQATLYTPIDSSQDKLHTTKLSQQSLKALPQTGMKSTQKLQLTLVIVSVLCCAFGVGISFLRQKRE